MTPGLTDTDRRTTVLATLAVVVAGFCWGLSAVFAKGDRWFEGEPQS
jgi:hypothetical protein